MRFFGRSLLLGLLLGASLSPPHALAQMNFDPSRVPDQFKLPGQADPVPPMPVPPPPAPAVTDPGKPHFVVKQVQIDGITVLDDQQVGSLIDPYIDRDVSLDDMQELANRLTQLYRDQGYVLSQVIIPPQRIDGGAIRMSALEGHITQVTFAGDADTWLQASAIALTMERPLKISTLQRWLLLANDAPGLTVTGNLAPDPDVPLGSLLAIDVRRDSLGIVAGFDNRGSKYVGPWQAYTGLQWNGMLAHGDTFALRGYTSHPDGQLKYVQIQQSFPLGTDGVRLETTADIVRSKPGDSLRALEAEGKTDAFKVALTYPLIRSLVQNLVIGVTAELSNSRTSILDEPAITPSVNDRTRVLSVVGSYNVAHGNGAVSSMQATLSRGFDVFDASQDNSQNPSRAGAQPEFWRGILEADHRLPLSGFKPGASLLFATLLQTSFGDSLLASEQAAAGGSLFGRGFDPATISGDQAVMGKVEFSVPFDFGRELYLDKTEIYTFSDAAFVEDKRTASGIEPHRQLLSVGLGFRASPNEKVSAYIEGAKQLPVSILSDGERAYGFRATLGMIARF